MTDTIVNAILKSDSLRNAITEAVDAQLSALRQHLIDSGLEADVVDTHLGSFKGAAKSPPPMRRMLGPNKSKDTGGKAPVKISDTKDPGNSKDKLKRKFEDGEVVLVLNYGAKSHALFGDFNKTHTSFKDSFLKETSWIKPNGRLAFGFGWVVMQKAKLDEVKQALSEYSIEYREVERKDYEKEIRSGQKSKAKSVSETEEGSEDESTEVKVKSKTKPEKEKPKAAPAKKAAPPAKKAKPAKKEEKEKPKAVKNDWGNIEEPNSGFIFMMLPVGTKGKKVPVAVGWQDPDADEDQKGLASVLPFDEELEYECTQKKWRYLTEEMIETIRGSNPDLAGRLEEMRTRDLDEEDEWPDEGSDEEGEGEDEELSEDDEVFEEEDDEDLGSDDEGLSEDEDDFEGSE